jgi:hypothetical protein
MLPNHVWGRNHTFFWKKILIIPMNQWIQPLMITSGLNNRDTPVYLVPPGGRTHDIVPRRSYQLTGDTADRGAH